jgi:hypothetical protein
MPTDIGGDDDDIIDYFLSNQNKLENCKYFMKGSCRFGVKCKYYHPLTI